MWRVHIVGCGPRSGTTLITEMMIACFDIDQHTTHEDSVFAWPRRSSRIFLTKKPRDILVVEDALEEMPNLHVIYMLRDPRDMVVSRHGSRPDQYWCGLKFWKTYKPYAERLTDHPRFCTVRYEELVHEPDAVQKKLMERLPFLVMTKRFSQFHESARPSEASQLALGGIRALSGSSIGNWRNHRARLAGQLRIHGSIAEDLIAYGYEQDDSWEQELTDIEPDLSPSWSKEHFADGAVEKWRRGRKVKARLAMLGQTRPAIFVRSLLWRL